MKQLLAFAAGLGLCALGLSAAGPAERPAGAAHRSAAPATLAAAPSGPLGFHVSKRIALPGAGGWDYLSADLPNHRLYISHGPEVLVLNIDNQKLIGTITGVGNTHGIAFADDHGFVTDSADKTIVEFDRKTLAKIKSIPAPKDVDGLIYDPSTDRVFAFCGDANEAVAVNGKTGDVVGTIALGGSPEFAAADGRGHVFNVLSDKNQVLDIDSHSLKILNRYPLAPCEHPAGAAIDAAHHRFFAACRASANNGGGVLAIVNTDNGKVIAAPKIGPGADAARFDPTTDNVYASTGDGAISVFHEDNPDKFTALGTIPTESGARTMEIDPGTQTLFTDTAKFGPRPAGAGRGRGRPPMIPGTFTLLVVTK